MKTTASELNRSRKQRLVLSYIIIVFSGLFVTDGFLRGVISEDKGWNGMNRLAAIIAVPATLFNLFLVYVVLFAMRHEKARQARIVAALMFLFSIVVLIITAIVSEHPF